MDTSSWLDLWGDTVLRQYFVDLARACSRRPEVQEDLLIMAWLAVGQMRQDRTTEHLMHVGFRVMEERYRVVWWVRRRRKWHEEAVRHRLQRRRKYFLKRAQGRPPRGID